MAAPSGVPRLAGRILDPEIGLGDSSCHSNPRRAVRDESLFFFSGGPDWFYVVLACEDLLCGVGWGGGQRGRGGVSQQGMGGFSIGQFKRDPETHFCKICKKKESRKTEAQQNCGYNFGIY